MEKGTHRTLSENELTQQLLLMQFDLFAYIVTLAGTRDAQDILQETNMQVIRLSAERTDIRNFRGWVKRLAFDQVRTWRQRGKRERLVFNDELLEQIADKAARREPAANKRVLALKHCMEQLAPRQRELFMQRHIDNRPLSEIAACQKRSVEGVSVALHRIRQFLRDCIARRMVVEERLHGG